MKSPSFGELFIVIILYCFYFLHAFYVTLHYIVLHSLQCFRDILIVNKENIVAIVFIVFFFLSSPFLFSLFPLFYCWIFMALHQNHFSLVHRNLLLAIVGSLVIVQITALLSCYSFSFSLFFSLFYFFFFLLSSFSLIFISLFFFLFYYFFIP